MRRIPGIAAALVLAVSSAPAHGWQETDSPAFTDEQLEQIAAPVALYPDSLLMQVFMAATYPLEVVEADRWISKEKPSGSALDEALKAKDWDPSVKSLCALPDVLKRMSENLDWTRDMGDAFLEQQAQLLDAVQRLRDKAYAAGTLKTTPEQTVTVQPDKIIVIESAQPEVVYVPTYSPTVVYGTWPYPTTYYAPLYAPPPAGYGALAFATGIVVGAAIWGGCNWGWGHSDVNINVNRYNDFNRNTNNNFNRTNNNKWQHNAEHRKGVNYRDSQTAQRFGGAAGGDRVSRNDARGFDKGQGAGGRGGAGGGALGSDGGARGKASGATREAGGGARGAGAGGTREAGGGARGSGTSKGSGGAFHGASNPSRDRAASSRGSSSRGSASRGSGSRSGGGASRGGGSRGGRGGGGSRGGRR